MSNESDGQAKRNKNELIRHILTLMTGTTIAQAFPLAAMPILTRLYTPEDFGVLALYVAIVSILSVVATGRYDLAVVLPSDDRDAASIVILSSIIALIIALILAILVFFFGESIAALIGNQAIRPFLYLISITTASFGIYQSFTAWSQRKKRFKQIAICTVAESGITAVSQVMLHSVVQIGGQIYGSFLGKIAASALMTRSAWKSDKDYFVGVTVRRIKANAKKYVKFPKFAVGSRLLGATASQLPVILIGRFFGATTVGYFSLSFRVLYLPVTFVSASVSKVLHPKIVEIRDNDPAGLKAFVVKAFLLLLVLISPLMIVMSIWGVPIFSWVFGQNWQQAGEFAAILSIAIAARFSVSPLSVVLYLEKNVQLEALWNACYFVTMASTLVLFRDSDVQTFLIAFAIHELILYGFYLTLILKGAEHTE